MVKFFSFSAVAAAAFLSGVACVVQEQAAGPLQTANQIDPGEPGAEAIGRDEAIRLDAQSLAQARGIAFDKALRIIRLNEERGDLVTQLRNEFSGRVAGISVVHEPDCALVVKLKGPALPSNRLAQFAAGEIPIRFEAGSSSAIEEMVQAYTSKLDRIRAIVPQIQDIGVDERTGQIAATVYAVGPAVQLVMGRTDQLAALLGHPFRTDVVSYRMSDTDVRGGSRITSSNSYCTSGFTVKNASGTTGMSTVGHCEGIKTYYNPNDTSIGLAHTGVEIRDADQDVEIHTSGYVERAEFYANSTSSARVLTGRRLRSSTAVGDTVCHRGETTGYSCGDVSKTNTILTYPNACNGVSCAATWVTVAGGPDTACYGGDSGGPVFISQTAVGLMKGSTQNGTAKGQCGQFYYMSTDYLPNGWTLLYG